MDVKLIGGHVSASGGVLKAFDNAKAIGANFAQIFTQSPRMWRAKDISDSEAEEFRQRLASSQYELVGIVTHASYLINLASSDADLYKKSCVALVDNLQSATKLGARGVVLHVGSHKGAGLEAVLSQITESLVATFESVDGPCQILLENTAGQGGSVGVGFDELARIIENMGDNERLGVCLDTQHLFASGVEFFDLAQVDGIIRNIEDTIGIDRLGCIHLNDSKVQLGSKKDRHENLGDGLIGAKALSNLISHPDLDRVPLVLEVPGDGDGPRRSDIDKARELVKEGASLRRG